MREQVLWAFSREAWPSERCSCALLVVCHQIVLCVLFNRLSSKSYTGSTAVLVDELNAGLFQGTADGEVVRYCHGRLAIG